MRGEGVRDPKMLIKVKKIYMDYFCTKTHLLSPLEKNISEKSFFRPPKAPIPISEFYLFLMNIHVQHFLASDQIWLLIFASLKVFSY